MIHEQDGTNICALAISQRIFYFTGQSFLMVADTNDQQKEVKMRYEGNVSKQNNFSRVIYNEAKLGAYYTDVGHARRIGRLFSWPDEEVCVLEPSIGDGEAVLACTENCVHRKIYGVELNQRTYNDHLQENASIYAIHADFLCGVKITNGVFSFCFANPPYGKNDDGERLERLFIEKMHSYIAKQGMLALVIPYGTLLDEKGFLKSFFRRFTPLQVYRFDDDEYEKYHQIVVVARKNSWFTNRSGAYDAFLESVSDLSAIPYLPKETEEVELFEVLPSADERIQYFTTLVFDADKAAANLCTANLCKVFGDRGFPKPYESVSLGRPPVPLSKDNSYLMAICGAGQGIAGFAETKDLHLQRGVVKTVTDHEIRSLADGTTELVETTHSKMTLVTVENNGRITVLE